jgi:hypothetical protein
MAPDAPFPLPLDAYPEIAGAGLLLPTVVMTVVFLVL